jgi:hypothetical protein
MMADVQKEVVIAQSIHCLGTCLERLRKNMINLI